MRRGGSRRISQVLDYPKAPARRSTFTLTKYLQSYIPHFPRREMSFARAGKADGRQREEISLYCRGARRREWIEYRIEPSSCRFSQVAPHHAAIWTYCTPRRANLLPLVLFRFGNGALLCRTVWRSVLQDNRHLTYAALTMKARRIAANIAKLPELLR